MRPNPQQRKSFAFVKSKWFLGITLTLFLLLSISLVKEMVRSYQINQEIQDLQTKITGLESENNEIADFVEYLKTDRYYEEQARLKFGLKSPGEKVIVLQKDTEFDSENSGNSFLERGKSASGWNKRNAAAQKGNPAKWFNYFFGG